MHFLVIFKAGICRALCKMLTWKQQVADMGTTKIYWILTLYLQCGIRWQYKRAMEVSNTYEKTNAHNAYCPIKEYFHLYSVQALESLGSSRVHQDAWAWNFQLFKLLRYFYTEISLV